MSIEMLRTTGNSIVADEMELSTLNNTIVGAHSPDGKWSTYNTPMNGQRIPSTRDIAVLLDLKTVQAKLDEKATQTEGALAILDVTDAAGNTVRLRDFGTSGHDGLFYSSWLPAKNVQTVPFSKTNPLRSAAISR
jgi:hypothetical protein